MGELSVVAILAFMAWVAWAVPSRPMEAEPSDAGLVFQSAVAIGVVGSLAWSAVHRIARKTKGRPHGHL